jgi:hypothetical protein
MTKGCASAGNGTADIALVYMAEITSGERGAIVWDETEYDSIAWRDLEGAIADTSYHPALRR